MIKKVSPAFILLSVILSVYPIIAQDNFFLDDWEPKSITNPADFVLVEQSTNQTNVNVIVNFGITVNKVSKYNFGNNANIYSTKMWDNLPLVQNLRNLNPHVLRFPGGNLSQNFFWNRAPGDRPEDVPEDIWVDYGMDESDDAMSVDNYYKLLETVESTGMITINYGYARYGTSVDPVAQAAHMAAEWVRYDNGRTKFWEIGNENFGEWQAGYEIDQALNQDGQPQFISGDLYGAHALIFVDSMKAAAAEIEHEIYIGFQAWETEDSYDAVQTYWNELMMPVVGETPDYYIVHNYYTPYEENSDASTILNSYDKAGEFKTSVYKDLSEAGLSEKPITLTEYNIFAIGSQQMVSHINGLHAVLVTGNVIKENYGLTARWNLANYWENGNDHGMFSQDDPTVPDFTPYPDFYQLTFFQRYFGDTMVMTLSVSSDVVVYSSLFSSGQAGIAIINKSQSPKTVELLISNYNFGERYYWYELKDDKGDGSFSTKVFINGEGPSQVSGGPDNYDSIKPFSSEYNGNVKIDISPYSAIYMLLDGKTPVGIDVNKPENVVTEFKLEQNYPNPFNPTTVIDYSIPVSSELAYGESVSNTTFSESPLPRRARPAYSAGGFRGGLIPVELVVYDVLGRQVATLVNEHQQAGNYSVVFDASGLANGLYIYKLTAGNNILTKKMLMIK